MPGLRRTGAVPTDGSWSSGHSAADVSSTKRTGAVPTDRSWSSGHIAADAWSTERTGAVPTDGSWSSGHSAADAWSTERTGAVPTDSSWSSGHSAADAWSTETTGAVPTDSSWSSGHSAADAWSTKTTGAVPTDSGWDRRRMAPAQVSGLLQRGAKTMVPTYNYMCLHGEATSSNHWPTSTVPLTATPIVTLSMITSTAVPVPVTSTQTPNLPRGKQLGQSQQKCEFTAALGNLPQQLPPLPMFSGDDPTRDSGTFR